ncbi:MAG: DMT family transporter, partial [Gammaproteobacteria bacterium]|nr:DMT family transporter [Gammaproteobacteria bacterium]
MSDYSNWNHILGGLSALTSALMWAIAAILFAKLGKQLSARSLNLGKGIIALVCLLFILFPFRTSDFLQEGFWYLALSGLLGICIGDTLYFLTLQRLGARLTLLVGTLIPVVTALSAIVLFKEAISFLSAVGLLLTIGGVTYVLWSKVNRETKVDTEDKTKTKSETKTKTKSESDCAKKHSKKILLSGVFIAIVYVLAESAGILLT